jgi:hypothetical protein
MVVNLQKEVLGMNQWLRGKWRNRFFSFQMVDWWIFPLQTQKVVTSLKKREGLTALKMQYPLLEHLHFDKI